MRIGYVLKCFPRLSETFILHEIAALERLGCEVIVFSRYRPTEAVPHGVLGTVRARVVELEPLLRERFWEPFETHRRLAAFLGPAHEASLDLALSHRNREEMRYWLLAGPVSETARDLRLDLLHAHFATGSASVARYASLLSGVPFSFTAHAKDIYAQDVDPRRLVRLLEEARLVVTVSEANLAYLRSLAPRANVRRVYNGVDLERFRPRATATDGAPALLLHVGRMVEKKGLPHLLDAVAILRRRGLDLRCRLVGTGLMEESLREQARAPDLADAVEFRGPASQEEVSEVHLAEASVFVLPAIIAADGDRDGLPTTLLEAMARGVPVVSTRIPGVPEAVPDGEAGLLAWPGDAEGLAEAIVRTLQEPEATAARVRAARCRVEKLFDLGKNAAVLRDEMERALAGAAGMEASP